MAKAGMWMQGAKGRTGDIVYAKGKKGQTIQRVFTAPSNPKTAAQMAQRIIFATVNQAASFMDPIVNHSFEGLSKAASRQAFVKQNIALLRSLAAQDYEEAPSAASSKCFMSTKNISQLIPNRYIISNGSIRHGGALKIVKDNDTVKLSANAFGIYLGENDNTISVKELLRDLGFSSEKDQLTICNIFLNDSNIIYSYNGDTESPGFSIKETNFQAIRLVPAAGAFSMNLTIEAQDDPVNTIAEAISTIFDTEKSSDIAIDVMHDLFAHAATGTITNHVCNFTFTNASIWSQFGSSYQAVAGAIILSRLSSNGKWLRSRAEMVLASMATNDWGLNWNTAIPAWFEERQLTDNTRYLNEGGDSNTI